MDIRAIIFDWGGVFVDAETKEFLPGGREVLEYCRNKGYRLALAVIASKFEERKKQIEESGLADFFEIVRIGPMTTEQIRDPSFTGKDELYDQINALIGLPRNQVLIVDDRTVRGIRYANQHGHPSVWIRNGKFAEEVPNQETGNPTFTIGSVQELTRILDREPAIQNQTGNWSECGEGGIRTHGPLLQGHGLANRCFGPLSHLSNELLYNSEIARISQPLC
jgi:phosphoglycolate phosphatase-like HAD superfamily hydrolase